MTYPQAIRYLESFTDYEKILAYPYTASLKLERIKGFLATIDNPQGNLRCIHIAGTKGKGSTCAFIAYMLREAGFKVGLYTSPHLADFRERIRILCPQGGSRKVKTDFEGMILKHQLVGLVERLKPAIEKYNRQSQYGALSFFEIYTTLAFVYFKQQKIDFAVLETGLGGRLDATNVVNPLVCAITSLSYEHTQKLGSTLKEIAAEKAGIIKAQSSELRAQSLIVITAPQEEEAIKVIRNKCQQVKAQLYEVGKDIKYRKYKARFTVKGLSGAYPDLKIRLFGDHQIINAALAIGVIEALSFQGVKAGLASVRKGLYNTLWPARCEIISRRPLIILDGAQNIASARALKSTIKENFKYKKLILVLGISQDKDLAGICQELRPLAQSVILTKANNLRATAPKKLAQYFKAKKVYLSNTVKDAREKALAMVSKKDAILVTGSLFAVGEFRSLVRR